MIALTRSIVLFSMLLAVPLSAAAVNITISCGAVGRERDSCEQLTALWEKQTGHQVTVLSPPQKSNERYFQYLTELGAGSRRIDVYQIDVVWTGLLAKHFIDLKQYFTAKEIERHLAAIVANNTVDGRLIGMPWFTDVGILYYRKDLLEKHGLPVPRDWAELEKTALYIQNQERPNNPQLWGYVFQGAAYEGLTCNALEWIAAYGGGTVIGTDHAITVNNPQAVLAIHRAAHWIGLLAPPSVLSFNEEDSRQVFQEGNAVFMRNWPYVWALLNGAGSAVANKVEVAPLPSGGPQGRAAGALGGWQLSIAKYSQNPEIAADLIRFMTSEATQKQRAISYSFAPTILSLYNDAAVTTANPFFAKMRPMLENAVARPAASTGENYMAVTTLFWGAVHEVLRGQRTAAESLKTLQDQLQQVKMRGGW